MQDPKTTDEWQDAVDIAYACLHIHSARLYGLIHGGPRVNADRCAQVLELGKARKIFPRDGAIERFVAAWQAQHGGEKNGRLQG
jgi:hypothetical protein